MCVICDKRPKAKTGRWCTPCTRAIETEQEENANRLKWWLKAKRVLHYRGHVISLVVNGDSYTPIYEGMPPTRSVPWDKLIDLDKFCPGLERSAVKQFKGCFRPYLAV